MTTKQNTTTEFLQKTRAAENYITKALFICLYKLIRVFLKAHFRINEDNWRLISELRAEHEKEETGSLWRSLQKIRGKNITKALFVFIVIWLLGNYTWTSTEIRSLYVLYPPTAGLVSIIMDPNLERKKNIVIIFNQKMIRGNEREVDLVEPCRNCEGKKQEVK